MTKDEMQVKINELEAQLATSEEALSQSQDEKATVIEELQSLRDTHDEVLEENATLIDRANESLGKDIEGPVDLVAIYWPQQVDTSGGGDQTIFGVPIEYDEDSKSWLAFVTQDRVDSLCNRPDGFLEDPPEDDLHVEDEDED